MHTPYYESDGERYNLGRAEGRADVAAALRAILDPKDVNYWNIDGLLEEVKRLADLERLGGSSGDFVEPGALTGRLAVAKENK